jgi:hypothetical protein
MSTWMILRWRGDGAAWSSFSSFTSSALSGQRKGPVLADELRELLATLTIDGEIPIWRKGLADWQPLRNTEIAAHFKETPPAVAANQVNNGLVWALAFAPLVHLFIDVALLNYQKNHPADDEFFETFLSPLSWLVPVLTNAVLCLVDTEQLKRARLQFWMANALRPAVGTGLPFRACATPATDADLWLRLDRIVYRLDILQAA